jgi:rod shape-determining protein MreD
MTGNGGNGLIAGSFITAFLLAIFPLPHDMAWARPEWVALVMVYWAITLPERVGLWTALVVGIITDGLEGNLLGQSAFPLAIITYAVLLTYQRLRMFAAWQQAFFVFVLIGVHQLLVNWVQSLLGVATGNLRFLLPAVTSALIWPWLMIFLRGLLRRAGLLRTI